MYLDLKNSKFYIDNIIIGKKFKSPQKYKLVQFGQLLEKVVVLGCSKMAQFPIHNMPRLYMTQ